MLDLKIAAVGSGPLIAQEIADAMRYIFAGSVGVDVLCVADLPGARAYDFYVCSTSQLEKLRARLPAEKIVLLALTPTAQFFISVARIPEGETIYIFNNDLEYTRILRRYCERLGIVGVRFRAIAYREMEQDEVLARLAAARYLIGVDRFIDGVLRATPAYAAALRPDVRLLAAQRVASVPTACALLQRVAARVQADVAARAKTLRQRMAAEPADAQAALRALLQYAAQSLKILQNAVVQAALSHVEPKLPKASADAKDASQAAPAPAAASDDGAASLRAVMQCCEELRWIAEKLTV